MSLQLKWKCFCTGALGGLVNGLLGAGGGTVIVPLFLRWVGLEEKKALATTVFTILPLCLLSAGVYAWGGELDFGAAWPYLAGGAVGGFIAGKLFGKTPASWLRRGFGALLAFGGLRMLLS